MGVRPRYDELEERVKVLERENRELRILVDGVPGLVSYVDKEGFYRYVNRQYEEWFGLAPEQVIGKHYTEVLGKEASERVRAYVEKAWSGQRVSFEDSIPYARGGQRWVIAKYAPDQDEKGGTRGFFGLVTDITERKREENAVRESEAWFSILFHASPVAIAITRFKDSVLTDVNKAWEKVTGFTRGEVVGHNPVELNLWGNPGDRERLISRLSEPGTVRDFEFQARHRSGSLVDVLLSADLIEMAGTKYMLTLAQDISERKAVERALRESEEKYRTLFEMESDALLVVDDESLQILDANAAAVKAYQFSKEELQARRILDLSAEPEKTLQAVRKRVPRVALRSHLKKDGTRFSVEINRRLFEWLGRTVHVAAVRDISDRLEAEKQLEETRDLLVSILDNAPALIYVSAPDHRYRLVNKAWENFAGKTAAQVVGRTSRELFSYKTAERFDESNRKVMETGSTLVYEESVLRDGKRHNFHTTKFALTGPEGRIEAVGGISLDVSSLKCAEQELRAAQEQLFHAQKMETLGTLVAGVAHEINNPINLVMFNVSLLQRIWHDLDPILEKEALREPDRKYGGLTHEFLKRDLVWLLQDMEMAANRVASITRGLKEYSTKSDMMERKSMLLNEAVQNSLRLAQTTLRKSGIRVELCLGENLPSMMGNLQAVEQVVINLLTNAIQAIKHERGEIAVQTGFDKAKGRVYVTVRDNGKGIDPVISERIFDPFFTDRQAEGGTGLGLAVSCNLVKAHGGDITFESEVGKGTTFRVSFPIEGRTRAIRILAVDDEAAFLEMIRDAFKRVPGYEVETASNGTEALLRLGISPPDLLILDLMMPGMDGMEVCRTLRSRPEFSRLRVVMVTGFPEDPRLMEIESLGISHVFAKPLKVMEFMRRVGEILEEEEKRG